MAYFLVVATVWTILAGTDKPVDPNGMMLDGRQHFDTLEACNEYMASEDFAAHKLMMVNGLMKKFEGQPAPQIIVDTTCVNSADQ